MVNAEDGVAGLELLWDAAAERVLALRGDQGATAEVAAAAGCVKAGM